MNTTLSDLCHRYESPRKGFFTRTRAESWPQGLLVGNGTLGAVIMGHPQKECLIVCHEELFLPVFDRMPVLHMAQFLPEIRRLIDAQRYDDAMDLVVEKAVEAGYPADFIMTDPSHPAFDLLLDFGPYADVSDYRRSVDFSTGEATVSFVDANGARHLRRSFVSRRDGVVVMQVLSDSPITVDVHLGARPCEIEAWEAGRTSAGNVPKGQFIQRGVREVGTAIYVDDIVYRCAYARTAGGYEGICRVITEGGETSCVGTGIRVRGTDSVLIVSSVEPNEDMTKSKATHLKSRLSDLATGYDDLLGRHTAIHSDLFNRISLDLGGASSRETPLEEQVLRAREEAPDPEYMERLFDACRYIVISSTGRLPPNLHGVWSATWTPHWSGDFTLDANVQAAISHMLSCGTPELMQSLFNLMDDFMEDFRENARRLYGAEGIFVNSRVSTTGLQQRYNRCPVYFWTAGAAWIAHYYWEYYVYTGDGDFLATRALPFMQETALFYETFLEEDADGVYRFSPSWSPENHAANTGSPIAINATMDIAACRELYTNLVSAYRILDVDIDRIPDCERIIEKLPPYLANDDGALKEWASPLFEDRYSHRHMSHLYPLYPGREADPDRDPELFAMSRKAVAKRLEHYDASDYGAFGLYHSAIAASRCGDAPHAWESLAYLARWHVYPGMATAHNPGPETFNVDMAGGFPAAIVEFLVGATTDSIRLLPAIPVEWRTGTICGICCPGQVTIQRLSWNLDKGQIGLAMTCAKDNELSLVLPDASRTKVSLRAAEPSELELTWVIRS